MDETVTKIQVFVQTGGSKKKPSFRIHILFSTEKWVLHLAIINTYMDQMR